MMILPKQKVFVAALLALVVLVGAVLRLYALDTVPPGLSQDEGFNATAAVMSLAKGDYQLFYMQGRWALTGPFIWLLAASMELFGNNLWAIRFVPAFMGVLTLVCFFWLCMEYWRWHRHALQLSLLSAAFLAVSHWHLHTTRLIFHGTLAPLCEVLALWSLLVALRKQTFGHYALAGVLFASGIYSYWQYIPFMLLPAGMILYWTCRGRLHFKYVAVFAAAALLTSVPFLIAFFEQDIFYRVSQLTVTNQMKPEMGMVENLIGLFMEVKKNAAFTMGMLFLNGDGNWRHNYNLQSSLGFLAQVGFVLSLVHLLRGRYVSKTPDTAMIWGWLLVATLPAILTSQAVPHSWRGNTMVLPLCMLAAYGMYCAIQSVPERFHMLVYALLAISFVGTTYSVYDAYFIKWGQSRRTAEAFDMRYVHDRYLTNDGPKFEDFNFVREATEINERRRNAP